MSRISPKDFVGTRARMHRLKDAKIFHGWIQTMFGSRIEVTTSSDTFIQIGDRFRFELHGRKTSAIFEASLTDVEQFDAVSGGVQYAVEGSNARVIEAEWITLQFQLDGQFRYANAIQAFRAKATNLAVVVKIGDAISQGNSVDVGAQGLAFETEFEVAPGQKGQLEVTTPLGKVVGGCTIRNCQKAKNGLYRVGLQISDMGRLDRPRWDRFISEL